MRPFRVPPLFLLCFFVGAAGLAGCGSQTIEFGDNRVAALSLARSRDVSTEAAQADVSQVVTVLFGTPDQPVWPSEWFEGDESRSLVSIENLRRAAGSVRSDQKNVHNGLYQEHCVVCHGVSGDGNGAAARLQTPYPRDFRSGVFKWKSTSRSEKPTRQDLMRVLEKGLPGSSMPSFANVNLAEREAMVDYVIYLSVRGETERRLLAAAVDELGYEKEPPDEELRLVSTRDAGGEPGALIEQTLNEVVGQWLSATPWEIPQEGVVASDDSSIRRGKEIFHGPVANCVGCHGPGGTGGLPTNDYDDWTKDFTTRIGISPEDVDAVRPMVKAGALPPRRSNPRTLVGSAFRGGDDNETLFRRVRHGIAGTPMPGVEISDAAGLSGLGLSQQQAWDLVHYLKAIKDES